MKRYLLFCLDTYYPLGGVKDFVGDFESVEEAKQAAHSEHAEILDTETRMVMVGWPECAEWRQWIELADHTSEYTRENPCRKKER